VVCFAKLLCDTQGRIAIFAKKIKEIISRDEIGLGGFNNVRGS
jgi:hypothetical protein